VSSTSLGPYTPLIGAPDSDVRLIIQAYGGDARVLPVSYTTATLPV